MLKKLFWPCVLGCGIHFVWQWCDGCCPSEGIDLYVWVSYTLRCWVCCLFGWWLKCQGRVMNHVEWAPLWTVCLGPSCLCVVVGPDCVLPYWWQKCHPQTSATWKGDGGRTGGLWLQTLPWRCLLWEGWLEIP